MAKPKVTFVKMSPDDQMVYVDGHPVGRIDRFEYTAFTPGPGSWREVWRWVWSPVPDTAFRDEDLESDRPLPSGRHNFWSAGEAITHEENLGLTSYKLPQIKKAVRALIQAAPPEERQRGIDDAARWFAEHPDRLPNRAILEVR